MKVYFLSENALIIRNTHLLKILRNHPTPSSQAHRIRAMLLEALSPLGILLGRWNLPAARFRSMTRNIGEGEEDIKQIKRKR